MRKKNRAAAYVAAMYDEGIIARYITLAEDKRTVMAKGRDRKTHHLDKTIVQPTTLKKG